MASSNRDNDNENDEIIKLVRESELFKDGLSTDTLMQVAEGLSRIKAADGNPLSWWIFRRKDLDGTLTWFMGGGG